MIDEYAQQKCIQYVASLLNIFKYAIIVSRYLNDVGSKVKVNKSAQNYYFPCFIHLNYLFER